MAGRPSQAERFDRAYYDRFYRDPKTRVHTHLEIEVLARFVFAYLEIAGIEPRRVVDLGCGLGFWRDLAAVHAPRARYVGVEISEYVCREFGWKQGSVVDFHDRHGFDLVICQGVLQYLTTPDCRAAIQNLGRLCRGALYLEALTKGDWEENCDRTRTDRDVTLRTGAWYRKQLAAAGFVSGGGGMWFRADGPAVLYELERPS
jgi:SAM-dependent methyltransferase